MNEPTEFLSLSAGDMTLSGFVTPADLARIHSGQRCQVVIYQAVGNEVELGPLAAVFVNGELSSEVAKEADE